MDHNQINKNRILNYIEKIENKTGLLFHESHPELAEKHIRVIDGKTRPISLINDLTKILDELEGQ